MDGFLFIKEPFKGLEACLTCTFFWQVRLLEVLMGLLYSVCNTHPACEPKYTVKSTSCPRKFSRQIQLTLNSSTVTPDGRLITNEATPSLDCVMLLFGSKSIISWSASLVCALRITGIPPTNWSNESLTCTCWSEQSKSISTTHHFFESFSNFAMLPFPPKYKIKICLYLILSK